MKREGWEAGQFAFAFSRFFAILFSKNHKREGVSGAHALELLMLFPALWCSAWEICGIPLLIPFLSGCWGPILSAILRKGWEDHACSAARISSVPRTDLKIV